MNAIGPGGFFTYARAEQTSGKTEYHDCTLLRDLIYDELAVKDKWQHVTFHDDRRCKAGARFPCIVHQGEQLMGWAGDELVLDLLV